MKALIIQQPYASLIACRAKRYETRSWKTNYRGKIAIHAGKNKNMWCGNLQLTKEQNTAIYDALKPVLCPNAMCNKTDLIENAPYGAIIAVADLGGCYKITDVLAKDGLGHRRVGFEDLETAITDDEYLFGDWTAGRYAWELANVEMLPEPIPYKGKQSLWNVPEDVERQIMKGLTK